MLGNANKTDLPERSKALPSAFPGDGAVNLSEAHGDLSKTGFVAWIMLTSFSRSELKGRSKIASRLSYSKRRCDEVLRELTRKGYVRVLKGEPGKMSEFLVERPAIIPGKGSFVRL